MRILARPDRAAVEKNLRELEKLFGRKSPPVNEIATPEQSGEIGQTSKLQKQHSNSLLDLQAAGVST